MDIHPIIILASDHAGFRLKEAVRKDLEKRGYHIRDIGVFSEDPSDYPDSIIPAAEAVANSKGEALGIVFGGSGIGECIAANKVKGIRAALAYDTYTTIKSREHNDANVLCLGGRTVTKSLTLAKRLVRLWLATPFSEAERHVRRINKISSYENR